MVDNRGCEFQARKCANSLLDGACDDGFGAGCRELFDDVQSDKALVFDNEDSSSA